jgi:hypothetical protein
MPLPDAIPADEGYLPAHQGHVLHRRARLGANLVTRYEMLCERLKQARATFEAGRRYAVWVNDQGDVMACWPEREPSLTGFRLAGVFTAAIGLADLVEAVLFAMVEHA